MNLNAWTLRVYIRAFLDEFQYGSEKYRLITTELDRIILRYIADGDTKPIEAIFHQHLGKNWKPSPFYLAQLSIVQNEWDSL